MSLADTGREIESNYYEPINFKIKKPFSIFASSKSCIFAFALVVSLVCMVGIVIYIGLKILTGGKSHKFFLQETIPDSALCVSCNSLRSRDAVPDDITELQLTSDGQRRLLCCLSHSSAFVNLIHVLHGQLYNTEQDQHLTRRRQPVHHSAHLYIDVSHITGHRLHWDSTLGFGEAHKSFGVSYKNGSIGVPDDGVYNIYSFLTLKTGTADLYTLVHSVHVHQELSRTHKCLLRKQVDGEGGFTTSFLEGSFKLHRGDKVYVKFSHPFIIYKYSPANYFGMFKL